MFLPSTGRTHVKLIWTLDLIELSMKSTFRCSTMQKYDGHKQGSNRAIGSSYN